MVEMPHVNPVLTQQPEVQLDSAIFKRGDAMSTGQGMQALARGLSDYGQAQVKAQIAGIEQTGKLGSMAIGTLGSLAGKMKENGNDFEMTFQRDAEGNLQPISGGGGDFGGLDLGGMGGGGGGSGFFSAPSPDEQSGANVQGPSQSQAYGHAITVTNRAAAQTVINENINALRNKFADDPDQFKVAAGKYADSFLSQGYPDQVAQTMWSHAVTMGSQYHIGMVNEKRERDLHNGFNDLVLRNGDLRADLGNVAYGTPADTPDFIEKSPEWTAYKENLVALQENPYFKSTYTPARVEHELNMTRQEAINQWAVGNAQRIRDMPNGGIDKAQQWAEKYILHGNSHMPIEQREAAYNNVLNKISSLNDEQKTRRAAASSSADALSELYSKGMPANEQQFNQVYNDAVKNFAPEAAGRLRAARFAYERVLAPAGGMNIQRGAAAIMGNPGGGAYASGLVQKYSGRSHGESEECVALVKHAVPGIGSTEHWSPAGGVTAQTAPGTPIATFGADGKYKNIRGQSHAAIYLGPGSEPGSIRVLDQWNGHHAAERTIKVGDGPEAAQNFQVIRGASGTQLADGGVRHPFGIGQNYNPGIGGDATMGLIRHFEGFREGAYWDVNHHRVGYGSDTITHADGRIETVGPNSRVSREDADRDLQRRVGHIQNGIAGDIGQENWNRLPEGARAALTSFGYNYGSLRSDVAAAARSGDPSAIAHAIMSHSGDNNGVNRRRREMEASIAMGGQVPTSVPGAGSGSPYVVGRNSALPFSAQELAQYPWLASQAVKMMAADNGATISYAKDQMNVMGEGFKFGVVPDETKLAEIRQIAATHPKELGEEMTKLEAKAAAVPLALKAAGYEGGAQQLFSQVDDQARATPDLYHMELAKAVHEQVEGRAKQIKEDPHSYAARRDVQWTTRSPTPFSAMGNPGQFGKDVNPLDVFDGALMQHRQAGVALMNHGVTNDAAAATFPDKTIADLSSYLSSASGQQAEALVAGLKTRLNDQEFSRLASDKKFNETVAGLTRSSDPQKVTAGFMFMERSYQENPFAFDAEHKGMRERMAYWNSAVRFMGYDEAKRVLMQDAASAGSDTVMDNKRKEVREQLKDYDTSSVLKNVSGAWVTPNGPLAPSDVDFGSAQVLTENWKRMVENYYVAGNDIGVAKNEATKTLQKYYGTSAFNGGRVMLAPPEQVFKTPQEMMAFSGQFNKFVIDAAHTSGMRVLGSDQSLIGANLDASILSDAQTLDAVAARQPPSYAVQVKDPTTGQTHLLMKPDGTPARFTPNMDDPVYGLSAMQQKDTSFYQNTPRWKRAMERGPAELFKGQLKFGETNG